MGMHFLGAGAWGVSKTFYFTIEKAADTDFGTSAEWTPATGDVKVHADSTDHDNAQNLPVYVGDGLWAQTMSATEMEGESIYVAVADAATKIVKDTCYTVITNLAIVDTSNRIAGIQGTKNDLDDLNDLTAAAVNAECDTALTDYDGPTDAEMIARTLAAASYATAANQALVKAATDQLNFTGTDVKATLDAETVTVGTNNDKTGYTATASTVSDKTGYSLSAAGIDAVLDEAVVEPTAIFTWPTTARLVLGYLGALMRNKMTSTATTVTLRDDADSADIAANTVSDDGTTYTNGEAT